MRKSAALVVGLCVLLITPYFLLRVVEVAGPSYSFTALEMREAVEGTWVVELTPARGQAAEQRVTFTISQARGGAAQKHSSLDRGWVRQAAACDHRTLIRSAEACIDETEMPLDVTLVAGGEGKARGELYVIGTSFEVATLELELGGRSIRAQISPFGEVLQLGAEARSLVRTAHD